MKLKFTNLICIICLILISYLNSSANSGIQIKQIIQPSGHKAESGLFSDAEYVMTKAPVNFSIILQNNGKNNDSKVNLITEIYQETEEGNFDSPILSKNIPIDLSDKNEKETLLNLSEKMGFNFVPQSYEECSKLPKFCKLRKFIPQQFESMKRNVTPIYLIKFKIEDSNGSILDSIEKKVRFYLFSYGVLVSAVGTNSKLESNSTPDEIAGKLNYDSLMAGLHSIDMGIHDNYPVDILDRRYWDPNSIDYTLWDVVLWSDGNNNTLTLTERNSLRWFLKSGNSEYKKSLIICSEEMVRLHSNEDEFKDLKFLQEVLRAENDLPGNPLGEGVSNDSNFVKGLNIGRDLLEEISSTEFPGDKPPFCGIMKIDRNGDGIAKAAYKYIRHDAAPNNDTMGVASTTINYNVIMLGVDWRHWKKNDRILRCCSDFIDKNSGGWWVQLYMFISQEDTLIKKVGDTIKYDITATEDRVSPAPLVDININDKLIDSIAYFKTDYSGKISYTTKVPKDKRPGIYEILFTCSKQPNSDYHGYYNKRWVKVIADSINSITEFLKINYISVFPNPFSESTNILMELNSPTFIDLTLYDLLGQEKFKIADGYYSAGQNNLQVRAEKLSEGIYFISGYVGDSIVREKVVIIK